MELSGILSGTTWMIDVEYAGCRDFLVDDIKTIKIEAATPGGTLRTEVSTDNMGGWKGVLENPGITKIMVDAKLFYKKMKSLYGIQVQGLKCVSLARRLLLDPTITRENVEQCVKEAGQCAVWELENAVLPAVAEMELAGTLMDEGLWRSMMKIQEDTIAACERRLDQVAREYFPVSDEGKVDINYSSPAQTIQLLRHLRIKVPKIMRDGTEAWQYPLSASKDALQAVSTDPVVRDILKRRSAKTIRATFGEAYLEAVSPVTGRLHFEVDQLGARTGRFTSDGRSSVNMLNIPKRGLFRDCFHPPEGYLCERHDYNGFELRIWAELSGDPFLCEAFQRGIDVHSFIASKLFQRPVSKEENEHLRTIVKELNFGVAYGMSPVTLYMKLLGHGMRVTFAEARQFYDAFCSTLRVGMGFLRQAGHLALKNRELINWTGRRRTWPQRGLTYADERALMREGMNFPIQSVGADIIKRAMVLVHEHQKALELDSQIFNQIYDELDTYTRADQSPAFATAKTTLMVAAAESIMKKVPVVVDCTVSSSWGTISSPQK